jgi:anti-sigma B factor antagonist
MQMTQEELDGGILKVTLDGALDIAGAAVIDMPFAIIAGTRKMLLLDFTKVDFLASIGVRELVKTAQAITRRGGKVVIMNPGENARKVLASTGLDTIVSVVDDEADAMAAFA